MRLFARRGKYDGVVCRAEHPRHGWGYYPVKDNEPVLRYPLRHVDGGWEYA